MSDRILFFLAGFALGLVTAPLGFALLWVWAWTS